MSFGGANRQRASKAPFGSLGSSDLGSSGIGSSGSAEAEFDRFFRDTSPALLGQAYVLSGEAATAQDLVQESFLRAWQHWEQVRGAEYPEAWVRRVLYNLAVSGWRRGRRFVPLGSVETHPHATSEDGPDPDAVALAAALRTLPRRQAQAIVLHDAGGLTAFEVAADLGVPEGTVRSWLSRGRAVLAALLSETEEMAEGAP
jgi:RNA polymerase sigma-70 factor, ECF subfamily